ncbi:MAG: hypothetical protein U9R69_10825 [Thermodesulfobacteriota bacterium]|nr:hypothetical protein [Thermodesulfobacteriota bacterium]
MRKLANLFLLLFLATALFGIADELLRLVLNLPILSHLQQLIWGGCIATGTVVYLGLGFNKHLPKIILIPLFIWLCWSLLDYWPLKNGIGSHFQLYASSGQLLLGIAILILNRHINEKSLLLTQSQFVGSAFSGRKLFYFSLISIPVIPIVLLLISYSFVANLIATTTAGFVQLQPNGLYMTERIYQQGDKQIRLAGMIHLGRKKFYTDLNTSIPSGRTLILAEGISDTEGLLTERFGYGKIADLLGLTSQENFRGRLIEATELAVSDTGRQRQDIPDILRADIDLKQFDPRTMKVLNALAKYVLNGDSLTTGYLQFNHWAQQHITPDFHNIIMADLVHKRNKSVVGYLTKALKKYDTLVIPWGALHMKGIEAAVLQKGFTLAENRQRLSIDFQQLPYRQIYENLTGKEKN